MRSGKARGTAKGAKNCLKKSVKLKARPTPFRTGKCSSLAWCVITNWWRACLPSYLGCGVMRRGLNEEQQLGHPLFEEPPHTACDRGLRLGGGGDCDASMPEGRKGRADLSSNLTFLPATYRRGSSGSGLSLKRWKCARFKSRQPLQERLTIRHAAPASLEGSHEKGRQPL